MRHSTFTCPYVLTKQLKHLLASGGSKLRKEKERKASHKANNAHPAWKHAYS